jgi:hypothetical protein
MNFSNPNENGSDYTPKELYIGKALYKVIAVNPNREKLLEMKQYTTESEPDYTFEREINGVSYKGVNIRVYLQNSSNFDIIDTVTYSLIDNVQVSATNKLAVINKYGDDTWLEQTHLDAKTMPDNMQWYVNEGVKPAIRGEKELVKFIRALRNFNKISLTSKEEDKQNQVSLFERADLDKILKLDFTDIRNVIMPEEDLYVGFNLGIRKNDEGKTYQDLFKEYPLRKYQVANAATNQYLAKEISESQSGGKYPNTYFDLDDFSFRKYDPNASNEPKADAPTGRPEDLNDLPF